MTQEHPITPPPELVVQWRAAASNVPASLSTDHGGRRDYIDHIATQAAQWGADAELEACCEWVDWKWSGIKSRELRASRRHKPSSLKEEALAVLESVAVHELYGGAIADNRLSSHDMRTIRRALEQLDD